MLQNNTKIYGQVISAGKIVVKAQYLCFQIDGGSSWSAQCAKSRATNKVIYFILEIKSFEQKCVIIKGLFYSGRLKQHMVSIVVDQSLSKQCNV